jgi:glycosyltransferase involved in cell wall biosynthesis
MSTFPKLLVLSTSLPGTRHGGGVVQDEILRRYPRDRYVCVSLKPPEWEANPEHIPASLNGVPYLVSRLTPEPRLRGARFYLPVLRALGFFLASPWRVRQAVAFGRRHGVGLVWAEFQGESLPLAVRVAQGLGVPLVGTIWDDPEGWLADGGYDFLSRRLLLVRFREALRVAQRVSVVSEAMQEVYNHEYGLKSQILRYGHDLVESAVATPKKPIHRDAIIVGFAGNVYGEDAWRSFLAACAQINTEGQLPPIKIQIFGSERFPYPHPGVAVTRQGWLPQREMLRRLAMVDFCYLPYWFMLSKRRHAEFSFPTKLTTYLAAGRPVLYHGPEHTEASRIMRDWGLGLGIHSLAHQDIAAALNLLVRNVALRESYSKAALRAFYSEFNAQIMIENFTKLIRVEPANVTRELV